MSELGFLPFDADNHYYEAEDAFTRHIDRRMAKRGVQWVELQREASASSSAASSTSSSRTRPSIRSRSPARSRTTSAARTRAARRRPSSSATRSSRSAPSTATATRACAMLDEQGLEAPALPDARLRHRGAAAPRRRGVSTPRSTASTAGSHEDWGFAYQERLFAVPMLSLMDPRAGACASSSGCSSAARAWSTCARRRCRSRPGSASPGDSDHDPFWARVSEAGVTVAFHAGDSGYGRYVAAWEGARHDGGLPRPRLRHERAARPRDHGHLRRADRARRLPRATRSCGWRASRTAPSGCRGCFTNLKKAFGQMAWAFAASRPARDLPPPRLGGALLRGRHRATLVDLIGVDARAVRLRLPARRGPARSRSTS